MSPASYPARFIGRIVSWNIARKPTDKANASAYVMYAPAGGKSRMIRKLTSLPRLKFPWSLRLLLISQLPARRAGCVSALAFAAATRASDNFNRANGGLGASWTATSDGAMSIASQQVIGTAGKTPVTSGRRRRIRATSSRRFR